MSRLVIRSFTAVSKHSNHITAEFTLYGDYDPDDTGSRSYFLSYSLNNGSSWQPFLNSDGSIRSYPVAYHETKTRSVLLQGLSPATNYKVKLKFALSMGTEYNSSTVNVTTRSKPVIRFAYNNPSEALVSWECDTNVDTVRYSTDNGKTYKNYATSYNDSSGNITIPNKELKETVIVSLLRTSNDGSYDVTNPYSIQPYGYINSANDITFGTGNASANIEIINPKGNEVILELWDSSEENLLYTTTTTETYISKETPIISDIDSDGLFQTIPNTRFGNAIWISKISYTTITVSIPENPNSGTQTELIETNRVPIIYEIDEEVINLIKPEFDFANNIICYGDLTSLTNNNQLYIKKYSSLTLGISTLPTAKKYSTMTGEYEIILGNQPSTTSIMPVGMEFCYNIAGMMNNIISVTAFDSRGYSTIATKELQFINYNDLTVNEISTERTGSLDEVYLNISGDMFTDKFGEDGVTNSIYSAKYYVSSDNETWSTGYNILTSSFVLQDGQYSLIDYPIHENGVSGGFTIGNKYYVKVELSDGQGLLSSVTSPVSIINDGKIARAVYKDSDGEYHIGINGLADDDYTENINGTLNVTGELYKNGVPFTPPEFKNTFTSSTTDAYSCNYINTLRNYIYLYSTSTSWSPTQANTYQKIPLNNSIKVGSRLTASNGVVTIGPDISHIKITASINILKSSDSLAYLRIVKNGQISTDYSGLNVAAYANKRTQVVTETMYYDVEEGDTFALYTYGATNDVVNLNGKGTTYMTVEVLYK